jgi:hypothetical protein
MKEPISTKPAPTAAGEARALAAKAKAAAEQAKDFKLLAREAKRRLKLARRDFKLTRKASKKARKVAKELQAAALAAARKAANLRRRKSVSKKLPADPKPAAAARTVGTSPAIQVKAKAAPKVKARRKMKPKPVAPLAETRTLPAVEAAVPAQGDSPSSVDGMAADSGGEPVPAPQAQADLPKEDHEPGR